MKTYTKSERLKRMHDISTSIDIIQDNLAALNDCLFEKASLSIDIKTDTFEKKGNRDHITCDKDLLVDYLEREQERLRDELLDHMDVLRNEINHHKI